MKKLLSILLIMLLPLALFAQRGAVTGKVTDATTGEALVGANVLIKGTALGAASGLNGVYKIVKVPPGSYTLRATFIGHKLQEKEVQVVAGQEVSVDFALEEDVIYGQAIGIVADRAKERETPVAFTNVEKLEMVQRLGSQDIPLILNTTPSVYATMQGGGAGDARVNVRGFNQRNVAIMINGVPINDMENGWVYWSNWDGVADATSSIQVQRGLSAVNLATPSIGGTMNIITDPTQLETGFGLRQEVGNDGFLKTTVTANSGLINDKLSFNGLVVRKTGDGLIDATWTDAWAYYFGASYNINPNNRIELYAIGAPQRHGQNSYKQNLGVYNADLAKDMDEYDNAALNTFSEVDRKYNQTWNNVDPSYKGKQYWRGKEHDRYDPNFINERENYYHKPIVNLNWYTKLSDDLSVYTVLYYSGGKGGGTGTYGSMRWDYSLPSRRVDWDATIARNQGSETGAFGILRNSVNEQW
ncbi:MAG: TonB-dependent receptor, partial [bacterium]|nr:TonB-dependent receptor [bacterium]